MAQGQDLSYETLKNPNLTTLLKKIQFFGIVGQNQEKISIFFQSTRNPLG